MKKSIKVKQKLFSIVEQMGKNHWLFTKCPEKDFSRKKKWSFEEILKFILVMEGKSLKDELLEYFDFNKNTPSNSSFNQRRNQILPEAFEYIFNEFTNSFSAESDLYKGYRLIACDGSDLCIARNPNDETTYFQSAQGSKGFNQLHLNAFYDLCSRTYVDAVIQPARIENEKRAMCDMIDRYKGKPAIFIADRNYENYNIFAHVQEKNMYYLIRVKDVNSTGILSGCTLPKTDEFDVCKSITLTKKQTKQVKANKEKYRFISSASAFDYLDLHTNKFYDMNIRIIRFSITNNSYECIITNLPQEEFTSEEIKQLYNRRWGIETSFRELKYAIGLSRFHSKKTEYITQEIWARLTLYNFCEIISSDVVVKKNDKRKYVYQLNYTRAIHICHHFIAEKKKKSLSDVEYLIGQEILPIRPGRTDPRKVKTRLTISFLYRTA